MGTFLHIDVNRGITQQVVWGVLLHTDKAIFVISETSFIFGNEPFFDVSKVGNLTVEDKQHPLEGLTHTEVEIPPQFLNRSRLSET